MKAVIIAGGLGTRLRPLTYNIPKPMVPVANIPFIVHQIELLRQHGIREIIINIHYLSEQIRGLLGEGGKWGVKLYYSIEEKPLGTAGAVKNAEEFFDAEPLIVFNGDILTDINLSQIIDYHKKKKAQATLTLTRVEDPTAYGLIILNQEGRVINFLEKPSWEQLANMEAAGSLNTINAGIYILSPKVFQTVPRGVEYSFERQLFPILLRSGEPVFGYVSDRYWMDIGKVSQYRQAHEAILRNEVAVKLYGTRVDHRAWIGDGVQLDKSAKLQGPAILGRGVKVGANTKIKDFTIIGDESVIGAEVVLERAIVWAGTRIGDHVTLHDCVIGTNCLIEDHVTIGNGVVIADNSTIKKGSLLCSK